MRKLILLLAIIPIFSFADIYNDENKRLSILNKQNVMRDFSYIADHGYDKTEMDNFIKHYDMTCSMGDKDYGCELYLPDEYGEHEIYLILILKKDKKTLQAYMNFENTPLKIDNKRFVPSCRDGVSGDVKLCFVPGTSEKERNSLFWETKTWMRSAG